MAPARPKKTASRKPAKKATAARNLLRRSSLQRSPPLKRATSKSAAAKKASKPAPHRKAASAADSVDEQLARYRSMRDFKITAEPSGAAKPSATSSPKGFPFVIQKHAASHLHYDFRLGWNGVLKSWAIAKGPSYYTGDRRLAVQVEDHPMEYGGFEGIIPKGQYGGGTVMVWDQGTWHPQPGYEDVTKALQEGSLKFVLDGTKLHGKWTLIRMAPRAKSSGSRWGSSDKPNWLLIKEHDDFERPESAPAITDTEPNSAVTGRTMDQIASQSDHVWNSKDTAGTGRAWYRNDGDSSPPTSESSTVGEKFNIRPRRPAKSTTKSSAANLPTESQPAFIPPQLAIESDTPPDGASWLHEIKLDGYRIQARKSGSRVQLLTRKGLDWTHRMRAVADAVAALPADKLTLDGEVVVLDDRGISSFASLQASFNEGERHPLTYFVFDILHHDGHNTRDLKLRARKELLASILPNRDDGTLRFSDHIDGSGPAIFAEACKLETEGIISKCDAPYRSGRSSDWLKSKCRLEQEFVIGGYSDSTEGPNRFGSLLLGVYEETAKHGNSEASSSTPAAPAPASRKNSSAISTPNSTSSEPTRCPSPAAPPTRAATSTGSSPNSSARSASPLGPPTTSSARPPSLASARTNLPRRSHAKCPPPNPPLSAQPNLPPPQLAARSPKLAAPRPNQNRSTPQSLLGPRPWAPSSLRLTHPDKILDPGSHLTKRQLADFYLAIADRMLPHIVNRPLSLVRCPEGAGKPCFFQKHVNHTLPPGITGVDVPDKKTGVPEPYITITTANAKPETLAGLAQMGVLEVHPWGSTNDDLEHPDRLIFDLDPDESLPWPTLCSAAADVRKRLKRAGLESFLKTTGGKGPPHHRPHQPQA